MFGVAKLTTLVAAHFYAASLLRSWLVQRLLARTELPARIPARFGGR